MRFKVSESDSKTDQQWVFGNNNECNEMMESIENEALKLSDIVQWVMTEMRQCVLINSQRRDNVYF